VGGARYVVYIGNTELGAQHFKFRDLKTPKPIWNVKEFNTGAMYLLFYLLLVFNRDSHKTYCSYYRRMSFLSTTQGTLRQLSDNPTSTQMCWYTLMSVHWDTGHNHHINVATNVLAYAEVSAFHYRTRSLSWRIAITSFSM
jgi:hypothetical protein